MFQQQQWGALDDDSADMGYGESLKSFFASILDRPDETTMGGQNTRLGKNTLEHDIFTSQDNKNELHEVMPDVQEHVALDQETESSRSLFAVSDARESRNFHQPRAPGRLADQDTEEDKDDISRAVSLLVRGRSITQGLGDVLLSSMDSFSSMSATSDRLQPSVRADSSKTSKVQKSQDQREPSARAKRASSRWTRLPTTEKSKRLPTKEKSKRLPTREKSKRKTVRRAVKRTKKRKTIKKRKTAIREKRKTKPRMKISKRNSCPACRGRRRAHSYANDCFKLTAGKRA